MLPLIGFLIRASCFFLERRIQGSPGNRSGGSYYFPVRTDPLRLMKLTLVRERNICAGSEYSRLKLMSSDESEPPADLSTEEHPLGFSF